MCIATVVLLMSGCGYVGDPLPPALHIPRKVTDLRVLQRDDRVVIQFTVPELTSEDLPLKLGKVDLRAGPYAKEPFDPAGWEAQAKALDTSALKPGPAVVECPAPEWKGQEVFLRVRIISDKKKDGGWSDFAILRVIAPLAKPEGLQAVAVAQGVRLSWTGPKEPAGLTFRIRRRAGAGGVEDVAKAAAYDWVDTATRYGETYEYSVQSTLDAGGARAESAASDPVSIVPVDRFPPAVPSRLTAMPGPSSIELSWDPNTETDFAGNYVYRAAGDGAFERVGALITTPSLSDKDVRPGVRYRYAISSVDQLGNESARSNAVEISMP
jgi:hypothetical protein